MDEEVCRKTPTNLLKMAETAPFSGSEDGEIVELEMPLCRRPISDKTTNISPVGPTGSLVSDTVASSGFHVGSEQKQLSPRLESGNGSQSSEGKCNGENSCPKNQIDSTVQANELSRVDTTDNVQSVVVVEQDKESADNVTTSETLDDQTRVSVPDETPVLPESDVTKDSSVQNGSAALCPTADAKKLTSCHASPNKLQLPHLSGLDGEFDIDMTDMIAAEDKLAVDEAVDNGSATVGNKGLDDGAMIEDDEELAVESTECLPQPMTSKDNAPVVLDDDVVPAPSNMASMPATSVAVVSPATMALTVTSDSCREPSRNGVKSDIANVEIEMESTVENSDNVAEELLQSDGKATSTQNEVLTNHVDNTTKQQENTDQSSTLDAEMTSDDKTVTTDDAEILVIDSSVNVEDNGLSEINKDLISAIEDLANVDKEVDTRETVDTQEESSDKEPAVQTDKTSELSKDTVVETPAVVLPSSDSMASTATSTDPSKVGITSSPVMTVVPRSPDVAEVSASPSRDTHEVSAAHEDTYIGPADADEDVDVITIGTEIAHPDAPDKDVSTVVETEDDCGTATECDLRDSHPDPTGIAPPSRAPAYISILKDSPRNQKAPHKTSSSLSSGTAPELMRTLKQPGLDTARIGVRAVSSQLTCDFCPMVFDDDSQLILHLDSHEKVCCATQVASTFEYSHHMYQCVACTFSTHSRMVFREHIRSHIVKFPYSCGRCHGVSESIEALRQHSVLLHPDMSCWLIPRHCSTLEQILHKLGPEAPSTVTRLQNTDGTPITATVLTRDTDPSAPVARPQLENKEQHPDAEQVIVLDDVDEEAENQNDIMDSHSSCHLKISSVVSLSDSAKAVENFSGGNDLLHSTDKDSVVVPGIQCQYINGLYQCKRCKYETPDRRNFRYHVVREVHERSNICHDCHAIPMATLLSESHHCPMVEKVMKAMRRPAQTSGDSEASATNQVHPDTVDTRVQPSSGVVDQGYILHIPDRSGCAEACAQGDNAGASGLRRITPTGGSPACGPHVRFIPVTSTTQMEGARTSTAGETQKVPTPVAVLASSLVHNEVPACRPSDVVVTPTPTVISPIVIQPINTTQLVGMPTTVGMTNRATYSTVCDGEMPHLLSPQMLDSSANNLAGCTGSWSTESSIGSFSSGPARFTPTDHRGGLDSSFTEAFSMLEELGNAQAGLCTLPQPRLNVPSPHTQAQDLASEVGRPNEVIIVPESPTELTPGGDAVTQVIEVQPPRTDVVITDTRSSPRLMTAQQGRSMAAFVFLISALLCDSELLLRHTHLTGKYSGEPKFLNFMSCSQIRILQMVRSRIIVYGAAWS